MAVKGSSAEARAALQRLCESYYKPVRNFIRRTVGENRSPYGGRDANDLTHDFFVRVLQGEEFRRLERGKGRFRSYLLGAVKFFLADLREKSAALSRGGKERIVSIDIDPEQPQAELELRFDRDWAEAIVSRAVAELRAEATASGETARFEVLRFWLSGSATDADRDRATETLGISKEHFKVLVSRLRKRFREKIRSQISQTVENATDINAELDYLVRVLREPGTRKA